jgi:hypothetical protein
MKKILSILSISVLLISGSVYASFPVKNSSETSITESNTNLNNMTENTELKKSEIKKALKKANKENNSKGMDTELIITLLLWFFLGGLAAHRWYKGKPTGWNILFILTAGGCGIWAIVDLINILTGKF